VVPLLGAQVLSDGAGFQRVKDVNAIFKEHLMWSIAMPPFVNIITITYDLLVFCYYYRTMQRIHKLPPLRLFSRFLTRRGNEMWTTDKVQSEQAQLTSLRLVLLMAHAKAQPEVQRLCSVLASADDA